jgi:TPR repeat protein
MRHPILVVSTLLVVAAVVLGFVLGISNKRSDELDEAKNLLRSSDASEVQQGLAVMTRLAEAGDPSAQAQLGATFLYGEAGVEKNPKNAFEWFLKSAEGGDELSQVMVGSLFASGIGTQKDEVEAVRWYRESAERGYSLGQLRLSSAYRKGIGGLEKNTEEALRWCRKAAEQGDAEAQIELGLNYALGLDPSKGPSDARLLFEQAAEQGKPDAFGLLARTFMKEKNYTEAVSWLEKGKEAGSATCEYVLGRLYEAGQGVPQDSAKALELYQSAAAKGNEDAKNELAAMQQAPPQQPTFLNRFWER